MNVLAVGELTGYLRELLDEDPVLQDLWLRGEVSNFTRSAAGHCYFTLKDSASQVRCVLFRGNARGLPFLPHNGDGILAHGQITIYEARGEYQLMVDLVQPDGVGPLQLAFEELRHRLEQEGLFDEARKRPLPAMPRCIGVVTSPTGAVWHDIQTVVVRRFPLTELVLAPAQVQGDGAPESIAAAIRALCADERIEVLIVARGGGSLEDLWAFNDERVARAIFAARVPVISGVGHEVDVTIADFVADLRAPTPSAAAELCVPDRRELAGRIEAARERLRELAAGRVDEGRDALGRAERTLARASPARTIAQHRQRLDDRVAAADRALRHEHQLQRRAVQALARQLAALDPQAVLGRGYAVVTDRDSGAVVAGVAGATPGRALRVAVADGVFAARVTDGGES
ncbi:MAG TPA: exodeoxyribonuclease VII large subunit [Thermomicrobiales bacterium]|nr:exodeoxyribonuclease VII large subunit [Thermomicrobiales bacterium]